jgi:hypothetical protein
MNNDRHATVRAIRTIPVSADSTHFPVLTEHGFHEVTVPRVTLECVARWANNEVEALDAITDDLTYEVCGSCGALSVRGACPMKCEVML